jgi:uncharacterized protein YkwD
MFLLLASTAHAFETDEVATQDFMKLLNNHRISLGLKALTYSEDIELVATTHSRRMAQKKLPFGHMGSKFRCRAIIYSLDLERGAHCGENVAMGQETAAEVFKAWIESPEHREAIEDPTYTHAGLGIYRDFRGYRYWTQIFIDAAN